MSNIVIQIEREDHKLHIFGESRELRQSLINIMKNGIERWNQRGTLIIQVKKVKENAVIIIKDTGKGMTTEQIEN